MGEFPGPNFFQTALETLRGDLPREESTLWLDDLRFDGQKGHRVTFSTASHFKKERITRQYLPLLKRLFVGGGALEFMPEVVVRGTESPQPTPDGHLSHPPTLNQPTANQDGLADLHPDHNFQRYVPHVHNRLALDCARKVVGQPGLIHPLYLYGAAGTGKTHLIQAIGHQLGSQYPFLKMRYVRVDQFVTEFVDAIRQKTDRLFRLKYRSLDVFLLDDVQLLSGKPETSLEFFHLFNEIYQPGKQLVFTSDVPPSELGGLDERIKSRLSSGVIAEIEPPEAPARKALLEFFLTEAGFSLDSEVLEFLARHLGPDTRRVRSAVRKLTVLRDLYSQTIDAEFCRTHLKECLNLSGEGLTPDRILLSVSRYSRHSLADLKSARRDRGISQYRQLAMFLLRKNAGVPVGEIARLLGGKSPSAVVQACQSVEERLKADPMLGKMAEAILAAAQ